ncbi:neuronal acetylcholine receptor subunit beta-4-like [Haliotis rufescens]|uniref:neuronal acetylcholine receptor subunit beta-4-like n=1 Tax=Haliotis rufescens TaxID=6454 RepID=UPI00201F489F|nr:neuronal acetylcholine receptor subunit beta-4-like [Haliotis rufescens]
MDIHKGGLLKVLCLLCTILSSGGHPSEEEVHEELDHESHLFSHLLDDHHYIRHLRPAGINETLTIRLAVVVTAITDLDESSQELSASLLLKTFWRDYRLSWNTSHYGGVSALSVPASQIWKPDFSMLHTMYGSFEHLSHDLASIASTGDVALYSHYRVRSRCPINISKFPYDSHVCHITLLDTSYSSQLIRLHFLHPGHDVTDDQAHLEANVGSQWTAKASTVKRTIGQLYDPELVDYISVSIRLARKSQFYHCVVVGPAVLIALLVPVIFLLHVDSTGKTTLGACVLICLTVLLKHFCDVLGPNRSETPNIAVFYVVTMALSSVSIIMASLVTSTSRRGSTGKSVPTCLSAMLLGRYGLRRWLCMDPYNNVDHTASFVSMKASADYPDHDSDVTPLKDGESELKEVSRNLRMLVGRYSADQVVRHNDSEWREVALVIDRLLFLIFLGLFLLTTLSLLT